MKNFLPLRREIREHWIYKDNDCFKVWVDILFSARFSEEPKTDIYKGTIYTINYSEFLYSRPSYSLRLNIPESKLRTLVDNLIKDNMIEKVSSIGKNKATIYMVVNYEKYNLSPNEMLQPYYNSITNITDDKNPPSETTGIKGIELNRHQLTTKSSPTDNQVVTTKEDCKKEKTEKTEKKEIYDYYMTLDLKKHRAYTDDIKKSIESAMKNNKYTIEYCKTLLDRHKRVIELTKKSEKPIQVRGLTEFFGQKAYQAKHLICSEYEEGGKHYERYIKGDNSKPEKPKFDPKNIRFIEL